MHIVSDCYYWSSSLDTVNPLQAYRFLGTSTSNEIGFNNRCYGLSLRPVRSSLQNVSYTITATAHPEEGGTITGAGDYIIGDTCTLTAIPNGNCVFANWKENGVVVSTDASYSFMVTRDRNLVAHFVNPDTQSFVDLGLPSGTLWANCNVGANSPEEAGDYFAWGETLPKNKYGWDTYSHCVFDAWYNAFGITKYTYFNYYDNTDSLSVLQPIDDAATNHLGNESRMPTQEEWQELMDNCTSVWTTQNGVEGMRFTGPSGDSIFLPGAGTPLDPNDNGYYWSSSLTYDFNSYYSNIYVNWRFAFDLAITPDGCSLDSMAMPRCQGCSVRAVYTEPITYDINATANMAEGGTVTGSGTYGYGQTCTLTATPNDGYSFLYWTTATGEILSTDTNYSFTVTEDADFVAYFYEGLACDITFALYNQWGDSWWGKYIMVTDENGASKRMTLESGFSVTYTIPFGHGSHPTLSWSGGLNCSFAVSYAFDGTVIYEGINDYGGSYEFEVDCSGAFPTYYSVTATANPAEGGTVSGGDTYTEGSTCTLTATANEGYTFMNWTQDGEEVSTNEAYSFTVTEDAAFVANFSLNSYNITVSASPTDGGTVSGGGIFDYGTTAIVSAVPNEDYRFSHWTNNGISVSSNANYSFTVTEDAMFVANFREFNPDEDIIQTTNLNNGWNWWSSYIELGNYSLTQLQDGLGTSGEMVKSQNDGYVSYLAGYGWYGSLSTINNESTYQIRASEACTVEMTGAVANPAEHPITLSSGWTWVGYPVPVSMAIDEALSGIEAQSGDMLKSQNDGFASYLAGFGWYGSLGILNPGMGLMYKSNNTSAMTLVYPNGGTRTDQKANQTTDNNHWQPNLNAYPDNMSVMAVVELDGNELQGEIYELAAFANGECRGSARLMYVKPLNRYMAFLTIAGDETAELYFSLYDTESGAVETQNFASLQYETNSVVGSFAEPYVIRFRSTTGVDEWANRLQIFPNPVERGQKVSHGFNDVETGKVQVEIINVHGTIVETQRASSLQTITAPESAGVYTLRVTIEGMGTCYRKLVVK